MWNVSERGRTWTVLQRCFCSSVRPVTSTMSLDILFLFPVFAPTFPYFFQPPQSWRLLRGQHWKDRSLLVIRSVDGRLSSDFRFPHRDSYVQDFLFDDILIPHVGYVIVWFFSGTAVKMIALCATEFEGRAARSTPLYPLYWAPSFLFLSKKSVFDLFFFPMVDMT